MKVNPLYVCTAIVSLGASLTAAAEDLSGVFKTALSADAQMQQAEAQHLATRETRTQALLNLAPVSASVGKTWSGIGTGSDRIGVTNPAVGTLGLSVNLFSWNCWIYLKSANATTAQGEANYLAAQQALVSRVTQRYFAVLSAEDQLAAQESALQSAARQLEQAERRFEVGLIANTDVQIARAARDSSSASVIAARRSVAAAEEQLRIVTGLKYATLASPRPDMPLLSPDPASEDAWVATALNQNASLIASRLAAEISHDQYLSAFGGHLPNVTLSASRNWALDGSKSAVAGTGGAGTGSVVNTRDVTWSAGISVPIFTAGLTQSKVRAARYSWDASNAVYDNTRRQTEQQTRDAYQGVISQIAQVQALQQAVESNRISLEATEAGYDVGTKTALDVLTARQQYVTAQSNYAVAKYGYLNNIVALRLAAGSLDEATINLINGWLKEPTPVPSTAPTAAPAPAPNTVTPGSAPPTAP
jgi:outer membrane protein